MKKKLMSLFKYGLLGSTVFSLVVFSGCKSNDTPAPTQNVWEQINGDSNLSMFRDQLQARGFDVLLEGTGPYTVFAPDNDAMRTLLKTLGLSDFTSVSPDVIDEVLSYHIVAGSYSSSALTGDLATVEGENITVVQDGGTKLQTGASSNAAITASAAATNGYVHTISTVIVPPTLGAIIINTLGTVAQPLLLGADFTVLSAGIIKAETFALTSGGSVDPLLGNAENPGILVSESVKTFFAPSDAVFAAASITADTYTGEQWYGLIRAHIVAGDFHTAAKFTVGQEITTMAGNSLKVLSRDAPTDPGNGVLTGILLDSNGDNSPDAQIAVLDVLAAVGASPANNGYIDAIKGVLSPQ